MSSTPSLIPSLTHLSYDAFKDTFNIIHPSQVSSTPSLNPPLTHLSYDAFKDTFNAIRLHTSASCGRHFGAQITHNPSNVLDTWNKHGYLVPEICHGFLRMIRTPDRQETDDTPNKAYHNIRVKILPRIFESGLHNFVLISFLSRRTSQ